MMSPPSDFARHRDMRQRHGAAAGRSFVTVERPVDIGGAAVEPGDCVLLEEIWKPPLQRDLEPAGAGEQGGSSYPLRHRCHSESGGAAGGGVDRDLSDECGVDR